MKTIGIVNSGGDCAGLNAVIASVIKTGTPLGYKFVGFEKGWEGILDPMHYIPMDVNSIRGITHLGGTILKTTNKGRFPGKVGSGQLSNLDDQVLEQAKTNLKKIGVDALVVIGGDGTLGAAAQLSELKGVPIVGVPKSIDNDLASTDQTFGFSTAVQVVVDALDKIHTTASSHDRVFIIETMGRNAGWIALHAGLAGGAHAILLPEMPFKYNNVLNFLKHRKQNGRTSSIIIVAEGAKAEGEEISGIAKDNRPELLLGGMGQKLANQIEILGDDEFEVRTVVLGHIQRGGSPNGEDRILAQRYGVAAMEAVNEGKFGQMVALKGTEITTVPILEAIKDIKRVTSDAYAFQVARKTGIYLGD